MHILRIICGRQYAAGHKWWHLPAIAIGLPAAFVNAPDYTSAEIVMLLTIGQ